MKWILAIWYLVTKPSWFPPKELSVSRHFPPILILIIALMLGVALWGVAKSATPQPVQLCPIASNTFAVPTKATDSLRTLNSSNVQACIPYSALTADMKLYGGNPRNWNSLVTLGIPLYAPTASTTPTSPVTPPQSCPDTFVAVNWSCAVTNGVATCTAPVN